MEQYAYGVFIFLKKRMGIGDFTRVIHRHMDKIIIVEPIKVFGQLVLQCPRQRRFSRARHAVQKNYFTRFHTM